MITYGELCVIVTHREKVKKLTKEQYTVALAAVGYTDDTPENWKAFDQRIKDEPELRMDILRNLP